MAPQAKQDIEKTRAKIKSLRKKLQRLNWELLKKLSVDSKDGWSEFLHATIEAGITEERLCAVLRLDPYILHTYLSKEHAPFLFVRNEMRKRILEELKNSLD